MFNFYNGTKQHSQADEERQNMQPEAYFLNSPVFVTFKPWMSTKFPDKNLIKLTTTQTLLM